MRKDVFVSEILKSGFLKLFRIQDVRISRFQDFTISTVQDLDQVLVFDDELAFVFDDDLAGQSCSSFGIPFLVLPP